MYAGKYLGIQGWRVIYNIECVCSAPIYGQRKEFGKLADVLF